MIFGQGLHLVHYTSLLCSLCQCGAGATQSTPSKTSVSIPFFKPLDKILKPHSRTVFSDQSNHTKFQLFSIVTRCPPRPTPRVILRSRDGPKPLCDKHALCCLPRQSQAWSLFANEQSCIIVYVATRGVVVEYKLRHHTRSPPDPCCCCLGL